MATQSRTAAANARGDQRPDDCSSVIESALETKGLAMLPFRGGLGDQGIPGRSADSFSNPVEEPDKKNVPAQSRYSHEGTADG